jgi:hypothetical protein
MPTGYQLSTSVKPIRVSNAVAAGTTAVNTTAVDCANADGVRFTVMFGALTANQVTSVKLQGGSLANGADAADLLDSETGTVIRTANLADADTNRTAVVEVYKPKVRYVRAVVNRATANAVIDGVLAELILRNPLAYTADATQAATAKGSYAKT